MRKKERKNEERENLILILYSIFTFLVLSGLALLFFNSFVCDVESDF